MRGKIRRPSGDWATPISATLCAGIPPISVPRSFTDPERGASRPEIVRSVVLLPAPFDPISVTISPSLTVSEMPFNAWIWP